MFTQLNAYIYILYISLTLKKENHKSSLYLCARMSVVINIILSITNVG